MFKLNKEKEVSPSDLHISKSTPCGHSLFEKSKGQAHRNFPTAQEIKRRERHSQLMHSNSRFFPVIHKKKEIFAPIHWILSDLFNQAKSLVDFELSRWITPSHAPGVTTMSDRWEFLADKSANRSGFNFLDLIPPIDPTSDHRECGEAIEANPTRSTPPKSTPGSIIFFEKGSNIVQKMRHNKDGLPFGRSSFCDSGESLYVI